MSKTFEYIDSWMIRQSHYLMLAVLLFPMFLVTRRIYWPATTVLLLVLLWLIKGAKLSRILILPIVATSLFQFGYYLYAGHILDQFFWMAVYATEYDEAISFFDALTVTNILYLTAYGIICFVGVFFFFRGNSIRKPLEKFVGALFIVTVGCQLAIFFNPINYVPIQEAFYGNYFRSVYRGLIEATEFTLSSAPIVVTKSERGPYAAQILVVLGESETRLRMGSYGYSRNTTPLIDSQAYLFLNNYAVGLNTQPNVQTLLTGLLNIPPSGANQDIFRVARSLGFTSIVIDNNGYKNTDPVVRLDMQADHYISMNGVGQTSAANDAKIKYDRVVLQPFLKQVREHNYKKALYVVHLVGSHPNQDVRYPRSFDKFPSYYDNSVLYSDYIQKQLRDIFFENVSGPAVIIYVSDHGVGLPTGCSLGDIPDPEHVSYGADDRYFSNYAIPLMVWTNDSFAEEHSRMIDNITLNLSSPVDQRFLMYSLAKLMGADSVNDTAVDTLSIFSEGMKFLPRRNVYGLNMDGLFQTEKICRR